VTRNFGLSQQDSHPERDRGALGFVLIFLSSVAGILALFICIGRLLS
jgi:hypothetical protein